MKEHKQSKQIYTITKSVLLNMSTAAERRLVADWKKLQSNNDDGIDAAPHQDNLKLWEAVIYGPNETIWQGGTFRLKVEFVEDYPNKPPVISFNCKMFHPNIYNDGMICLDILQNKWSPMYDISALLTSIRSLLSDPNSESPANQEAARIFSQNKGQYQKRVKEIVELSWKTIHSL